ncbi:MAG: hypothetical protein ACREFX_15785 [Opitutaceae bacterium]
MKLAKVEPAMRSFRFGYTVFRNAPTKVAGYLRLAANLPSTLLDLGR